MQSKFFTSRLIAEKTTQIRGTAYENAYLIEGASRALLIDTLTGAGNLASFCRELTDLPIQVALTHGHADHAGGCFDFGVCSMHPDDIRFLYDDSTREHRRSFITRMNSDSASQNSASVQMRDLTPPCAVKTYPLYDGDLFELGGRTIEVIAVPGHSRGTLVFLDRATRIAFSGDACNTNTLLYLNGSTSISDYKKALLRFKERQPEFDSLWGGHGDEALPPRVIDEALILCDRILDGTDDAEERGFFQAPFHYARNKTQDDGMLANIGYRKDWILKAPEYRRAPLPV
jgi:glyoxylase-like metal-dependent hydrolase (beta-lactamase superfamily II)